MFSVCDGAFVLFRRLRYFGLSGLLESQTTVDKTAGFLLKIQHRLGKTAVDKSA